MTNKKKLVINEFKTRTIFPFYIDNLNRVFYGKISNNKNKNLVNKILPKIKENLDVEEIGKIFESENLVDIKVIKKILNFSIKNILSIVDDKHNLFEVNSNNDDFYISEKRDTLIFEAIGSTNSSKRYNYAVNINKKNIIFHFVEQIQIAFYLDQKNNMLAGGISFNWGSNKSSEYTYNNINEKIYLINLIKVFIVDELKNLSLNTIVSLFDDGKINKQKFKSANLSKNKTDLISFKKKWNNLINSKYLCFIKNLSDEKKTYYQDDLFYQIFSLLIINLIIYEDLKIYFRSKSPYIILSLIEKPIFLDNNKPINFEKYFYSLINYVENKYFNFKKLKLNKITTANDALDFFSKFNHIENHSFSYPIITYELTRLSDIPFIDQNDNIFLNSNEFKIIFLIILKPELFGLNNTQNNFIEYDEFINLINVDHFDKDWEIKTENVIKESVCESNYDYITFINDTLSFLIIKNDNPINEYEKDPNRKLFNNYLWAQIFIQSRISKLEKLDSQLPWIRENIPSLLRTNINEISALQFDWNENFYGIPEIKLIIKKMNQITNVKSSIISFLKKINEIDRIYGKTRERRYLSLALMTASLFGLLDFFTMIFTVVAVEDPLQALNPSSVSIISVGAILTFGLLVILMVTILKPIISNHKHLKESKG